MFWLKISILQIGIVGRTGAGKSSKLTIILQVK